MERYVRNEKPAAIKIWQDLAEGKDRSEVVRLGGVDYPLVDKAAADLAELARKNKDASNSR